MLCLLRPAAIERPSAWSSSTAATMDRATERRTSCSDSGSLDWDSGSRRFAGRCIVDDEWALAAFDSSAAFVVDTGCLSRCHC